MYACLALSGGLTRSPDEGVRIKSDELSFAAEHLKEKDRISEARAVCLGCPKSLSLLRYMILGMQACTSDCGLCFHVSSIYVTFNNFAVMSLPQLLTLLAPLPLLDPKGKSDSRENGMISPSHECRMKADI